jgi:hypothetical protein
MHYKSLLAAMLLAPAMLLIGCGDSGPLYQAKVFFEPVTPISGKNVTMRVEVTRVAGGALIGGTVSIDGTGAGTVAKTVLVATGTVGTYVTTKVLFPADGAYTLNLEMSGADGTETHSVPISATCGSNGEEGAPCCDQKTCLGGLACVYGVCRGDLMGDAGPCHDSLSCQSGVCTDEVCAAPVCDDGVKNGKETDIDCGGSCDAKCASLGGCKADADCINGACLGGVCGLGPGELIGVKDKKDPPKFTTILAQQMNNPADLAFSSLNPSELWVVNPPTDSFTVIFNPGKKNQTVGTLWDKSQHFMENVMAIDFSDNGTFGTVGESDNSYGGQAKANNFMGPVLWPGEYQPYTTVGSTHSLHWDMLHSSPFSMGIAAITGNQYYVFNGKHGTIDWYDFAKPHVPGGTFHGDGQARRYKGVKVKRVAGTPSHLDFSQQSGWLYVADTGNSRVFRMNDQACSKANKLPSFGGDGVLYAYSEPQVEILDTTPGGLQQPSGIVEHAGTLYVGDTATGKLHAYDVKGAGAAGKFGKHLKSFATGLAPGKLGGLAVGEGRLYVLDRGGKVLRLDP